MLKKVSREYVTDIVKRTDEGIEKLGYILGCRDIKQKIAPEELDKIISQIGECSTTETINGIEISYGESLHCLIIIQK